MVNDRLLCELTVYTASVRDVFLTSCDTLFENPDLLQQVRAEHDLARSLMREIGEGRADVDVPAKVAVLSGMIRRNFPKSLALFLLARKAGHDMAMLGDQLIEARRKLWDETVGGEPPPQIPKFWNGRILQ